MDFQTPYVHLFKKLSEFHGRCITADAPQAQHPGQAIRIPLHPHQLAVMHAMAELERGGTAGIDCSGETLYTSYGVLGDSVGAGKSLMVLGHIAAIAGGDPIAAKNTLTDYKSKNLFSVKKEVHPSLKAANEGNSIIIVPHTLFRQWSAYIKEQTTLKAVFIDRRKVYQTPTFKEDILAADVVLVSNTLYKEFSIYQQHLRWRRAFIDEVDTIIFPSGYQLPKARFTWYITASWTNTMFNGLTMNIYNPTMRQLLFAEGAPYEDVKSFFQISNATAGYTFVYFNMASSRVYDRLMNFSHPLRGQVLIKCSEAFVQQSIQLPPLYRTIVRCRPPVEHSIVDGAITQDIREMLHGGDISGAMVALGVKTETTTTIVAAVTEHLEKELERLRSTLAFKAGLEYSTPSAKKAALEALAAKIKEKEATLEELRLRIENYAAEACPICYDDAPADRLLTPCCTRTFCAGCILSSLAMHGGASACPMCRATIAPASLKKVVSRVEDANVIVAAGAPDAAAPLEKKETEVMRLLEENPQGRFLIFSRYDAGFAKLANHMESAGIRYKHLKGSADSVMSTLRQFEAGKFQCLLLNARYAGSGLNITAATHVVLMHAMTHAEEKQILGRAHRVGREGPLHLYKMLYPSEATVAGGGAAED